MRKCFINFEFNTVCTLEYKEDGDDFYYIFRPNNHSVEIEGLDYAIGLDEYVRKNMIPAFLRKRFTRESRDESWDEMIRTGGHVFGDNFYVTEEFMYDEFVLYERDMPIDLSSIVIEDKEKLYSDIMHLVNGEDIECDEYGVLAKFLWHRIQESREGDYKVIDGELMYNNEPLLIYLDDDTKAKFDLLRKRKKYEDVMCVAFNPLTYHFILLPEE